MTKIYITAVVGVLASALVSSVAIAQTTEEVTVEASRIVKTTIGHRPSGVPIVEVSLSYGVSTAGLDLATKAGAAELEKRVKDAALAACKETSRVEPFAEPSEEACAKAAADKAMVKVRKLVDAAAKKPAG